MAKERDILQSLFARLSEEYAQKDWQIEAVDLRWGISQEAGFDNKTMQICKSEIKRCQQLSPRPNFIVLLGNRYGWTPLPETIPYKIGKSLKMSTTEKELFNRWYRLDENTLPDGEYVLQERLEQYRDAVTWFDDVEYPLSQMFLRNAVRLKWKMWEYLHKSKSAISRLFGESATEQEIHLGALDISDSKEHVIAYLRDLSDIPEEERSIFQESGESTIQKLEDLKFHLESTLSTDNILKVSESYSSYSSSTFDELFEREMEERIRRVVDNAIVEYNSTAATTEDEVHLAIAAEESRNFVGRAKELAEIDQYINDLNEHRPLWIKSASGSGKSALLAKVIQNHQQTHHVICRFCGRSAKTRRTKELPFGYTWNLEKYLKSLTPPTLIVFDALNQLDDKDDFEFASLKWLDVDIPEHIKIIISTTDEVKFSQEPAFLKIYKLPDMGTDSEELVLNILHQSGRRLTSEQLSSLHQIIDTSDHSALYLHILGHYLKHAASWDYIGDTPSDLEGLVREMIHELARPERHGGPIVGEALSFLTLDRIGLTDNEMIDLLSANDYVCEALETGSFHPIDMKKDDWRIPSVLWSRLRYDLAPFLRTYTSPAGQVTTIYHDELKWIFLKIYLNKPAYRADTASRLFHYYKGKIHSNDTHALLEIIHSTIDHTAIERGQPYIDEAAEFICSDLDFLLTKYRLFPQQLMEDFNSLLPFFEGERRDKLASLKIAISSLPKEATNEIHSKSPSNEQLLLYMYTLPENSILYRLASERLDTTHLMPNLLSNSGLEDSTVYALSEVGELPCMSDDGTKVASLFENRHNIRISDLVHPDQSVSITSSGEVLELQCDDMMKYLAMRFENACIIYDIRQEKQIFSHNLGQRGWMTLSADGETFALGDSQKAKVFKIDHNGSKHSLTLDYDLSDNSNQLMCGSMDYEGKYLWLLFNDRQLFRCNIVTTEEQGWKLEFNTRAGRSAAEDSTVGGKEVIELYDSHTCIPTCTANKCVCFHDQYVNIICVDNEECWSIGYVYWWNSPPKPVIAISRDENYLLTLGGKYQYAYCHIDKLGKHCELDYVGHSYIDDLTCINGDLSLGLRSLNMQVIKIANQLKHYEATDGWGGINSLSCSSNGNHAIVSYGKNLTMERKKEVICYSYFEYKQWLPPFNNKNYPFVAYSDISQKGHKVALGISQYDSPSELLIWDSCSKRAATTFSSPKEVCHGITMSEDGKYVVVIYGGEFDNEVVSIINMDGKLLSEISNKPKVTSGEGTFITSNNRFLITFIRWESNSIVFDLISNRVMNETPFQVPKLHTCWGESYKYLSGIDILGNFYCNNSENSDLCIYSLINDSSVSYNIDMTYAGISPTGRILYLTDKDQRLYKSSVPFNNKYELLMEHVKWIVTALDEAHLYVITDDEIILLFNIETKQVEQKAYCGGLTFHQVACAKGLYTANIKGDIYLFKPDDKLKVNIPAATSFIRRWNLETKEQEEPTAVCPMCGHQFGMSEELSHIITEIPSEIKYTDWDNPQLKGHVCPHCGAQLQFNPYIT